MIAWGVQPDGTELTPAPGMLVAVEGHWYIITRYSEYPDGSPHLVWLSIDPPASFYPNRCTYLAPAPTPGGLWDALQGLCMPEDMIRMDHGSFNSLTMACGTVIVSPNESPFYYLNDENATISENLSAVQDDLRNFGALMAYCAQEGWNDRACSMCASSRIAGGYACSGIRLGERSRYNRRAHRRLSPWIHRRRIERADEAQHEG